MTQGGDSIYTPRRGLQRDQPCDTLSSDSSLQARGQSLSGFRVAQVAVLPPSRSRALKACWHLWAHHSLGAWCRQHRGWGGRSEQTSSGREGLTNTSHWEALAYPAGRVLESHRDELLSLACSHGLTWQVQPRTCPSEVLMGSNEP